jgi:transposase
VTVDLNSVNTAESRQIGPELAADHMWIKLGFDRILNGCGFNPKQTSLAKALIIGRLIHPASELETWNWFNNQTSLNEMTPVNISGLGRDSFYKAAHNLYRNRDKIETELYNKESTLFSLERSIFLFDLTNTYFEGKELENNLAKYGKSKEKRNDCKLASLALVVDGRGFPVYSRIYEGNQSEPKTLSDILTELGKKNGLFIGDKKPVLVMDRGIATKENIELLKENGYAYTVIERGPKENEYEAEFRELKEILIREDYNDKLNTLGWVETDKESGVYVKKINQDGNARVLTFSISKGEKELSMDRLKDKRFLYDMEKLNSSIEKGSIVISKKIYEKIGRIKQKYPGISAGYSIEVVIKEEKKNRAAGVIWKKEERGEKRCILAGCYIIETSLEDRSAEEIWKTYTTITRVEAAFRDLKSDLGIRPIYHQLEYSTMSHLFIGVLAYHLLIGIETTLKKQGDKRDWKIIRGILSTHQRTTVILTDENRTEYHIRVSGIPETAHSDIYQKLGVSNWLNRVKKVFHRGSSA